MATNASTINYVVGEPIPTHRRAFPCRAQRTCSIPEDVRLWIAKVRERLEHIHRRPITQKDGHALLRESIDIAQTYNCYESNAGAQAPSETR